MVSVYYEIRTTEICDYNKLLLRILDNNYITI